MSINLLVREMLDARSQRRGHHDAQNLATPDYLTLEPCYTGAWITAFIFIDWAYLRVFHVCDGFVFCALLHKHACGTGKGCDENAVVQTRRRRGSETPATVLGCGETPRSPPGSAVATTNTWPYVDLSGCHPVPGCWRQPQCYRLSEGIKGMTPRKQQTTY